MINMTQFVNPEKGAWKKGIVIKVKQVRKYRNGKSRKKKKSLGESNSAVK